MRLILALVPIVSSLIFLGGCTCQPTQNPPDEPGSGEAEPQEGSAEVEPDGPTEEEVVEATLGDDEAFTALCLQWARELLPDTAVESPSPLELRVGETRILLANTHRVCRNNPSGCRADFHITVAHAADQDRSERPPVDSTKVRAVLANADAVAAARAHTGTSIVSRPFIADIELVYVVDEPTTIRWATPELLAEADISEDDVHDLAMQNTRRDLGEFEVELFDEDLQIYGLEIGDAYENSRVILHDLWAEFAASLPSPLVVVVPSRGVVLASHIDNRQGVMMMMSGALRAHAEHPQPISMTPLQWTEDGWEVFEPPVINGAETDGLPVENPAAGSESAAPNIDPQ